MALTLGVSGGKVAGRLGGAKLERFGVVERVGCDSGFAAELRAPGFDSGMKALRLNVSGDRAWGETR